MKTEVVDVSPTRKELKIEIDADAVRRAYDNISTRYAQLAAVPGFRKGRAPVTVVRQRFRDEIRSEVLRELVPQAISDAITENALQVIGEPDVHLDNAEGLTKLGAEPISVHAHVEVLPEVALGEYKAIEAERRTRPVTDADVERVIEGLRESSATLQPVEDRGAELGDTVTVNFNGKFVETPDAEDINVDDVDVELGGSGVQEEFTDNLLGVRADEERQFTVHYPADFSSKGLAGKTVAYTARVTAVRRKEMPELDDEWAKSIGEEYDSLATLRQKVREDLERRVKYEADSNLRAEVMNKLIDQHPFEVPQTFVEHQANERFESAMRDMMRHGIDPRQQEMDWERVGNQLRAQAERDVRGAMLLEEIANAENIEVSDDEIEAEIESLAKASRQAPEQVRAALTKQGGATSIADRLRNRKALDLVLDNARVADAEWREEDADAPNETEAAPDASSAATIEAQPAAANEESSNVAAAATQTSSSETSGD